jgi:hypothetical protein
MEVTTQKKYLELHMGAIGKFSHPERSGRVPLKIQCMAIHRRLQSDYDLIKV